LILQNRGREDRACEGIVHSAAVSDFPLPDDDHQTDQREARDRPSFTHLASGPRHDPFVAPPGGEGSGAEDGAKDVLDWSPDSAASPKLEPDGTLRLPVAGVALPDGTARCLGVLSGVALLP
jgi:hypothetical protein